MVQFENKFWFPNKISIFLTIFYQENHPFSRGKWDQPSSKNGVHQSWILFDFLVFLQFKIVSRFSKTLVSPNKNSIFLTILTKKTIHSRGGNEYKYHIEKKIRKPSKLGKKHEPPGGRAVPPDPPPGHPPPPGGYNRRRPWALGKIFPTVHGVEIFVWFSSVFTV